MLSLKTIGFTNIKKAKLKNYKRELIPCDYVRNI